MSVGGTDHRAIARAIGREYEDDSSYSSNESLGRTQPQFGGGPPVAEVRIEEEEQAEPRTARAKRPRRTHSVAHEWIEDEHLVLLHLDLETGGEAVGVVQLSCVAYNMETQESFEFDECVRPPDGITANDWSDHAVAITGINPNGREIRNADPIQDVWPRFIAFCEEQVPMSKVGCLVAWNGQGAK